MIVRGVIEGFYGRPWTWDERIEVARWCAERGMTHYLYAPKDDPKHRSQWREAYDTDELGGFGRLVGSGTLDVGFAVSPGLTIDYRDDGDRRTLAAKLTPMLDAGVRWVCLALDDIPVRDGLGEDQAALTAWLRGWLDGRADLVLVPTEYVGTNPSLYLDALAAGVPDDVPIAWTGSMVVNDRITAAEAEARTVACGGRKPFLWDNYPVNDAIMGDRLFMGPLRGREPALLDACSGYLANPMVQPRCSKLPLASVAAYLRGDDPDAAWAAEADAAGLRVFAEACNGEVPRRLVEDVIGGGDSGALHAWLNAAAVCTAPGLEGEADRWVEQVQAEAGVGLAALAALHATEATDRLFRVFALISEWPRITRSDVTVMGERLSFSPCLGQGPDSSWIVDPSSMRRDRNAIDRLCAHVFSSQKRDL